MDYLTAREQGTAGEGALFSTRNEWKFVCGGLDGQRDDHMRRPRPISA